MKVYITKYALTRGIEEKKASEFDVGIEALYCEGKAYFSHEWHLTKKEAIERAEQMRISEINKLLKRIKKLENLKFE